jgi:hypothetical protein
MPAATRLPRALRALLAIHCQRAPLVARRIEGFTHQQHRIAHPGEIARGKNRRTRDLHAGLFQREQMTGEVPAVHARDVLRVERARSVVSYQL